MTPQGANNILVPVPDTDKQQRRQENILSAKHFTLTINPFASFVGSFFYTLSRSLAGVVFFKLVTLFLIGREIPSFLPSQQPLQGNAD